MLEEAKFGIFRAKEGGVKQLWIPLAEEGFPDVVTDELAVTWTPGTGPLVITVPHAGILGQDTSPAGSLVCGETGHVIETRKGTMAHPIKTYARDATTDIIAREVGARLQETRGLTPHIVECHLHRSKVECNRDLSEIAVAEMGQEAEFIYTVYHKWTNQALEMAKNHVGGTALLVDLHGHGHPHDLVELGFRLKAELLNEINNDKVEARDWRSVVTSSARHEFTMRHLLRRRFGSNSESVKEAIIGETSFSGCLSHQLAQEDVIRDIGCVPSLAKPCPGRLGYYTGGYTVKHHSQQKKVDAVQVELPMSVRTGPPDRREAMARCLADGLRDFLDLHYQAAGPVVANERSDSEEEVAVPCISGAPPLPSIPPPPLPPPPPALVPSNQSMDGITHMAAMSKSKMHAELVRKAKEVNSKFLSEEEKIFPSHSPVLTTSVPPPPPPPPGPPPPPPPPPAGPSKAPADLAGDGLTHMAAMSKTRMHEELITRARKSETFTSSTSPSKAKSSFQEEAKTVMQPEMLSEAAGGKSESEPDTAVLERRRVVQELLRKEEGVSNTRVENEKRRKEFFTSQCAEEDTKEEEEDTKVEEAVVPVAEPIIEEQQHVSGDVNNETGEIPKIDKGEPINVESSKDDESVTVDGGCGVKKSKQCHII